jgi:hypothetical protein
MRLIRSFRLSRGRERHGLCDLDSHMTSRRWCVSAVAVVLALTTGGLPQGQGPTLVDHVNPRPRMLFGPGEYERFVAETTGVRRSAFESLAAEVAARGARAWNERDLQLESQALTARVLLDRQDPRGETFLGYARQTVGRMLERHVYVQLTDSHALVTEGSRLVQAMALAHDWLYPRWTADERDAIEQWLADELTHWVDTDRLRRASASPFRNDAARGVSALVLGALTLYDVPAQSGIAQRALAHAQPYYAAITAAHTYAGLGGGMAEGTFYGNFTAFAQTLTAEALYTAAGMKDAYTRSPFYAARLQYATHASWPGYLTNQFGYNVHQLAPVFGDARRGPTGSALYHRATVLLLGKRFPHTPAAREAYWAVNRAETSRPYIREWSLYDVLFWSPDVQPTPPSALAYREPSLGQVFARSDWTDDATWMSFNAGPHLDTHQHYDAGNLTIFRGVDLAVDSGTLDDFGSRHWFNYYARTVAHNTITITDPGERWEGIWGGVPDNLAVNDGGQRTAAPLTPAPTLDEYLENRAAYDQGRIERYDEGRWGVYVRANLTNAYQNPAFQSARPNGSRNRPKVSHVGRELVYLRGEGRRDAFVVFDRVVSTDPSFKKAVLWHSREPFESKNRSVRVDEGETRYEGGRQYDFESLVSFKEGNRQRRARLFVTTIAVDPITVRAIGRRVPVPNADHVTFNIQHHHRHVKDYYVEDSRNLVNPDRTTGAWGRPEWPPFNPPEQQWLFNDDLVGGWGQTRLQVEPASRRQADRFLTVLVPTDEGANAPTVLPARAAVGDVAGAVIRQGSRNDVVVFSADPNGGELTRGAVDVNLEGRDGDVTVATLTPGARYAVRMGGGSGRVQRITIGPTLKVGVAADAAGIIRIPLSSVPRVGGLDAGGGQGGSISGSGAGAATVGDAARLLDAEGGTGAEGHAGAGPAHPGLVAVTAETAADLADWDARITRMLRAGELRVREVTPDGAVKGRTQQRLTQIYRGVPVFGGDVTRSLEGGRTVGILGALYTDIALEPVPTLTRADATAIFDHLTTGSAGPGRTPELMVLPTDDGEYVLTYRARIATKNDVEMMFIDADTGDVVLTFSDLRRPAI